ncbi:hypothetical protein HYH03_006296 [Edaphochlamys debaryana]|uniref:Radical SAM core domain-containing protein n=1 Tax=Edaphochlamys debaryana TaxID=47281 RepID=A0A835Y7N6_9CHLO|nr:hypothetical protein HYH03_006296 [Edaphochlamys debaryana]|eukprot:KAG2495696.1 hypothetical protein HYH03_006296 [Edaphochlamys debaryana]
MQRYVDTLLAEIAASRVLPGGPLETVFFGGGTPSLLPPELLARILEALDARVGLAGGAEVSMEADPGTFDGPRLREYMRLGVTRLSVGVQAFQQELLTACGRGHNLADVRAAIDAVHEAGPPSWSLDLISGLPGLTPDMWRESLQEAVAAGPGHVSVYDLQVEEGTPFERWRRAGRLALPPDDAAVEMYGTASELLGAAGFEHYEVSNYARAGHRCAHNQVYWLGLPYYAYGMGAASYLEGRRFTRPAKMRPYEAWVAELAARAAGGVELPLPGDCLPRESPEELLLDTLMLRLRTADGLDLAALAAAYGPAAVRTVTAALAPHERRGGVAAFDGEGRTASLAEATFAALKSAAAAAGKGPEPLPSLQAAGSSGAGAAAGASAQRGAGEEGVAGSGRRGPRVRLADPQGFLLSNDIISDVFAAFDITESGRGQAAEEAGPAAALAQA